MTTLGIDTSNHDIIDRNGGRNLDWAAIRRAGARFGWHKVSDGLNFYADPTAAMALAGMRANLDLWGGYHVLWGNRSITAQLDWFSSILDRIAGGWRTDPRFVAVWDCEPFGYNTAPSIDQINAAGDYWLRVVGRSSGCYCPPWHYGSGLNRLRYPLISSNYAKNDGGWLADLYPGDGSSRWQATPQRQADVLQYGSNAIAGPHHNCDGDAYRGTVDQLRTLLTGIASTGDDMAGWNEPLDQGTWASKQYPATAIAFTWEGVSSLLQTVGGLTTAVAKILESQGATQADIDAILAKPVAPGPTDAQVAALADRITQTLVESNANGLTAADHDAVVADVKRALREGAGAEPTQG